jgi:hypothetical protein
MMINDLLRPPAPQLEAETWPVVRDDAYWQRVQEIAAARPELTPGQQDELASIVAASRLRRAREAEGGSPQTAQAMRTIRS